MSCNAKAILEAAFGGVLLGMLLGGIVTGVAVRGLNSKPKTVIVATKIGTPRVVSHDDEKTVTAIPVTIDGKSVICTFTLDLWHDSWSMAC